MKRKGPVGSYAKNNGRGSFPPPAAAFRARLLYRCLLLFFLLPLGIRLLFAVLPAMGDFFLSSRGMDSAGVSLTVQILAVLDDAVTPALTSAAVCTLGYGIFRNGPRGCSHALIVSLLSPLLLRLLLFLLTALLVLGRMIDSATPGSFAEGLPSYFWGSLALYAADLLFILAFVLLYRRNGKRFLGQEMALAGQKPIYFEKSGYSSLVRLTAAVYIARRAFGIAGEIFAALAGRTDGWSIAEIAKNYGFWSKETLLRMFSGGILPLFYLFLTGLAVILFSRYAAGKIEEIYFSSEKKDRTSAPQKEKAAGSKNEK